MSMKMRSEIDREARGGASRGMKGKELPEGRLAALITAAGLSSRMGAFKPLLDLGGKTFLQREIDTLKSAGVRDILVITGHRHEEVESTLAQPGVSFLWNRDYETSKMFDSVSMGLRWYQERMEEGNIWDGLFFLPVDVPLFSRFTLLYEQRDMAEHDWQVFCPYYQGRPGHPLLIRMEAIPRLLAHDGTRGLRGACEKLGGELREAALPDAGAVMDADSPEDYGRLRRHLETLPIPDDIRCRELLEWFKTPEATVAHGRAVADLAEEMAEACAAAGLSLDRRRLRSAALLHDLARAYPDHARLGARWLTDLGHTAVAPLVEGHMQPPRERPVRRENIDETILLYLADKLMLGSARCALEERFANKREKFAGNPEALAGVERRYREAADWKNVLDLMTGRIW